jgi:hypothetical protein
MLEALSLTETPAERPGRFTELLQPAGFEALAGIPIKAKGSAATAPPSRGAAAPGPPKSSKEVLRLVEKEERERRVAEEKRRDAVKKAEIAAKQAREAEGRARKEWERATEVLEKAERALAELRE